MEEYLEFASRGRNAWWRYLLVIVLALLLAMLGLAIIFAVLMLAHLFPADMASELTQPKNAVSYFLWAGILFGAFPVALMAAARLIQKKRPGDITGRWRWKSFFQGVVIWAAVQFLLVLIDVTIAPKSFSISAIGATAPLAVVALVGLLVQTFAEEFIFRGYLTQGLLLALKRPLPAAIVSGLLFGSLHIANGVPQALNAVVFGIVCALMAIRTGGIALTWGLHLANNYFGAVIVVSSSDVFKGSPGVIVQATPQLVWWDLSLGIVALLGMLWLIFARPYYSAAPDR